MLLQTLITLALVAAPLAQASDHTPGGSKSLNSGITADDLDPENSTPSGELMNGCYDEPRPAIMDVPAPEDAAKSPEGVPAWCCSHAKSVRAGSCQEDIKLHPYYNDAMPSDDTFLKSMFRVCATEPVAGKHDFGDGHLWGWTCTDDHNRPAYWQDDTINPEDNAAGSKATIGTGVLWIAMLSVMVFPSLAFGAAAASPEPSERHPGEPHEKSTMPASSTRPSQKDVSKPGIDDCVHETIKWSDAQEKTCCDLWATEEAIVEEACWTIDEWMEAMEDWVNSRSTDTVMIKDEGEEEVAAITTPEVFKEVTSDLCQQHGNGKPVCRPLETYIIHHGEIVSTATATADAAEPTETSGSSPTVHMANVAELSLGVIAALGISLGLTL